MKKYSFQMTKEEVTEFCLRAIWEQMLLHRAKGLLLLAILALEYVLVSWIAALGIVIVVLLALVVFIARNNFVMKKELCGKTRTIGVEDGMLKQVTEGVLYSEIPCSSITEVRITRHLLMLGLHQAPKVIAWYLIPLRVFADEQERDWFVESVRNSQVQAGERAAGSDMGELGEASVTGSGAQAAEKSEQEYFRLSFQVGEEEWVRMLAAATENVPAGTLREHKGRPVRIALAAVFSALLCGVAWVFPSAAKLFYVMSLMGTIISLLLLRNLMENPKKRIRTQIRKGIAQSNNWGIWNTSVTEMGIRQSVSGKNSVIIPWESLLYMVETDTDLLFYQKDKRHFSVFPKAAMESREQMESLKELCREKHVEVLAGKRKKYVPNWLFSLLIAVVLVGYVAAYVVLIHRDSGKDTAPDYAPLDKQVAVLRSFGFTIPEEMEQTLGVYVEKYELDSFVESYPYIWLLSNLAGIDDEEWADKGQDGPKVFWFDFEGWDIYTDYIRVLEGMQKISAGSILDDVGNIREDTGNVNWERGTGTITVFLEWNGQEHSWKMDVENDWIDAEVLGIYNGLLEKEGISERFYMTGDAGQGVFVFYCTGEWASEFEDATGLDMETYMVKKGW